MNRREKRRRIGGRRGDPWRHARPVRPQSAARPVRTPGLRAPLVYPAGVPRLRHRRNDGPAPRARRLKSPTSCAHISRSRRTPRRAWLTILELVQIKMTNCDPLGYVWIRFRPGRVAGPQCAGAPVPEDRAGEVRYGFAAAVVVDAAQGEVQAGRAAAVACGRGGRGGRAVGKQSGLRVEADKPRGPVPLQSLGDDNGSQLPGPDRTHSGRRGRRCRDQSRFGAERPTASPPSRFGSTTATPLVRDDLATAPTAAAAS